MYQCHICEDEYIPFVHIEYSGEMGNYNIINRKDNYYNVCRNPYKNYEFNTKLENIENFPKNCALGVYIINIDKDNSEDNFL